MKAVVYVLAYDEASLARAQREYGDRPWARVVLLPDPAQGPPHDRNARYMEGAAFLWLLPSRRDEWRDADFVGTLSWRASDKIHVPPDLEALLEEVRGSDVVALLPSVERLVPQAIRSHPRFLECWLPLMQRLGVGAAEAVGGDTGCFFCNYWLATPGWMDAWLAWFARAVDELEACPEARDALWAPSGYRGRLDPQRLRAIYGTDWMPMMPFVAERLAPFFFSHRRAVVTAVPLGRRAFWEEYYAWEHGETEERAAAAATLAPLG